jgi:hypothetical protein
LRTRLLAGAGALALAGAVLASVPAQAATAPAFTCTFSLSPATLHGQYQTVTIHASLNIDALARVTYLPATDLGLVHRSRGKRLVNGAAAMYLPGSVLSQAPASDFLVTVKKTTVCTYVPLAI